MFVVTLTLILFISSWASADENATCGEPPLIERTILSSNFRDSHQVGSVVEYDCEFGYLPSHYQKTITCKYLEGTDIAEWTEPEFTCIPRSCGDPGYVSHARRNGSVFTFPSRITYICDVGYKLVGVGQRFCQTNGQWSGSLPTCKSITCVLPDDLENGYVIYDGLDYGTETEYKCKKGFTLSGSAKRLCSENGTWKGDVPQCLENQCPFPESPLHGSKDLVGGKPDVGNIVIYSCDKGFKLFGSATSKCLTTGDWTFPAPMCIEPCEVPDVIYGHIGFYKGTSRWRKFEKLTKGSRVEDSRELYLKCFDKKYEAAGQARTEIQISCANGQWTLDPVCKPAACRSVPPSLPNAKLVTTEHEHGTALVYLCNKNFLKTAFGSTICNYGIWKGSLPVCTDTRCSRSSLNFVGLSKKGKEKYFNNEVLSPVCLEGYEIANPTNAGLVCISGEWKGNFPPCKPAKCTQPPSSPRNGYILQFSSDHGSIATIACNEHFQVLANGGPVQCSFGKWRFPDKEVCIDTQCYLNDLHHNNGVDVSDSLPTAPGRKIEVKCLQGFDKKYGNPLCANGKWTTENNYSPCQPSQCVVGKIQHGELKYTKTSYEYNWLKVRFDEIVEYRKEVIGAKRNHGSDVFLACTKPYIFNGQEDKFVVTLQCKYGKWDPTPLCLIPTSPLAENLDSITSSGMSSTTLYSALLKNVTSHFTTEASANMKNSSTLSTFEHAHLNENKITSISKTDSTSSIFVDEESLPEPTAESCSCIYSLEDTDVVAYSGMERLGYGSKVKLGCSVQFSCHIIGYHRLVGSSKLTCENCVWHSSQFPSCVKPSSGDATVSILTKNNSAIVVNPSGVIILPSGISANISCKASGSDHWPQFPNLQLDINPHYHYIFDGKTYDFVTEIIIRNTSSIFNGRYECKPPNGHENYLDIAVQGSKCPELHVGDSIIVNYTNEKEPNSEAKFHCLDADMTLRGDSKITCLPSGDWSSDPPACQYVECAIIVPQDNLIVTYKGEKHVNTVAEFHCLKPYVLRGMTNSTCLPNGLWSVKIPTCEYVTCPVRSLMDGLSEEILPKLENVTGGVNIPHGTMLQLKCSQSAFKAIGTKNVTCTETGTWLIGDIICVPGCDSVGKSESDSLIVDPNKELYRFGEYVTFSCPPGLSLNLDIERMMCLGHGWSEKVIPDCE